MVTLKPATCVGRGTVDAVQVTSARFDPKIESTIPGAYVLLNDAPWARLVMTGGPDAAPGVTATVIDVVAAFTALSPLYSAAMLFAPICSCAALSGRAATANAPVPLSATTPSCLPAA